jgi:hypothetical protein
VPRRRNSATPTARSTAHASSGSAFARTTMTGREGRQHDRGGGPAFGRTGDRPGRGLTFTHRRSSARRQRLAWLAWNHPQMLGGTQLWVGGYGGRGKSDPVAGGPANPCSSRNGRPPACSISCP